MKKSPESDVIYAQNWVGYNYLTPKKDEVNVSDANKKIVMAEMDNIIKIGGSLRNYFVLGVPQGTQEVSYECLAKRELVGSKAIEGSCPSWQERESIVVNELLKKWSEKHTNVFFIDPNDFLCESEKCLILDSDSQPIYSDKTHLSVYGTNIIGPRIFDFIKSKRQD